MFIQIINGVQTLLKDRMKTAARLITGERAPAFTMPKIRCYIGSVTIEQEGQETMRLRPQVGLLLEFQSLRSEAARIEGAGIMAEAVMAVLAFQDLGLDITELVPLSARDVTTKEEDGIGTIKYLVTFETSFTLDMMEDEDAAVLMKIGLSYYLQEPGDDGVADMEDVVDIPE